MVRKVYQKRQTAIWLLVWMFSASAVQAQAERVILASGGKAAYTIVSPQPVTAGRDFAAAELQKYLKRISGADFHISVKPDSRSIVAATLESIKSSRIRIEAPVLEEEEYCILMRNQNIYLLGGGDRGVLYAVYHFLSGLGCQWFAPSFHFYENEEEYIPTHKTLTYPHNADIIERPAFKYRKYYVEEGLSHTTETLLKMIDWMPKARINTLVFPIDYQGHGRVRWDNWRNDLVDDMQKRAITIEVGGHGYQNFISPAEDEGALFVQHPEWFGMDNTGQRSANPRMVFCTSNKQAVSHLHKNIFLYLENHPEIAIFDFWPPDSEIWCECAACTALGPAPERHIRLVNQTARFLEKELPDVRLQCLAYSRFTEPPQAERLDSRVLLDFCPINQSFEYQIYDPASTNNKAYAENLALWLEKFEGEISIYTYYRKYAWRSLPVLIPRYMQKDLKYYRDLGVKGISVYAEPGDWFTYGANQYVLSRLAWNPDVSIDTLVAGYCRGIFGPAVEVAVNTLNQLENVVRRASGIPYTARKNQEQYSGYLAVLEDCKTRIEAESAKHATISPVAHNLDRLRMMVEYALANIEINYSIASGINQDEIDSKTINMKTFIRENAGKGVFIPRGNG